MIKKGIFLKLTAGFVVIVLISMLALGLIFINIFRQYAFESRQITMLKRAHSISEVVSANMQSSGQMRGFGGMKRFLDTMAEAKVWITDKQGQPMNIAGMGGGMGWGHSSNSEPLPQEAGDVLREVLSGKESVSEGFSKIYNEAALTIGVPIWDEDEHVIGSVLLQTPITGITDALNKTVSILAASLFIALLIAVGLGIFYSLFFTRPLRTMNRIALEMARGNYASRTGINRQDEIGQLGSSLDLLASELSDAIEKINKLEQVRRDFVANVSHEFRTPLTVIRGSLEALSDGTVEDKADIKRYCHRMLAETRSLERLVSDLLELSRFQSGKITIHKEQVHIPSLLSDVVKSMQTIAGKKDIQLICAMPEQVPPVLGDYDRLRQLFIIFIDNSIKYSPDQTIIHIRVSMRNMLEIDIQDQGFGIPAQELPFIWERFYKADKTGQTSGTGLGLAIARHLVQLHGGQVSLHSVLGEGTTATVRLPLIGS